MSLLPVIVMFAICVVVVLLFVGAIGLRLWLKGESRGGCCGRGKTGEPHDCCGKHADTDTDDKNPKSGQG